MIEKLFTLKADNRLRAKDLLVHPWLLKQEHNNSRDSESTTLGIGSLSLLNSPSNNKIEKRAKSMKADESVPAKKY